MTSYNSLVNLFEIYHINKLIVKKTLQYLYGNR